MNRLTSMQRKVSYGIGIVVCMVPIMLLGMPPGGDDAPGGHLAQLRQTYELGEHTLGQVDPTSATMNLVLLGLRGVAADLLWLTAHEQQETKNWSQLRATVDSIILLQPHFVNIWKFQGWNLAWNVSAEWDAIPDRYFWVKEGAKFLAKGTARNRRAASLHHDIGRIFGQKIGRSDEWQFFREYFIKDPDEEKFHGLPDPDINREGKDNYLRAKDVYLIANDIEQAYPQPRGMHRIIFRQQPWRSQLDYAGVRQREGKFDEITRVAWEQAFNEWTGIYGREEFETTFGNIRLESEDEEIKQMAEEQGKNYLQLRMGVSRYQDVTNYRYWRTRAMAESEYNTEEAHREIYDGQQLFKEGKYAEARDKIYSGMQKFEMMLRSYPKLMAEDDTIDEGVTAVLYWQYILQLQGEAPPADFPLKALWDSANHRIPRLDAEFKRDNSIH